MFQGASAKYISNELLLRWYPEEYQTVAGSVAVSVPKPDVVACASTELGDDHGYYMMLEQNMMKLADEESLMMNQSDRVKKRKAELQSFQEHMWPLDKMVRMEETWAADELELMEAECAISKVMNLMSHLDDELALAKKKGESGWAQGHQTTHQPWRLLRAPRHRPLKRNPTTISTDSMATQGHELGVEYAKGLAPCSWA